MGRPLLGKSAKDALFSARVEEELATPAGNQAERANQTKSQFVRRAVQDQIQGPPIWVTSHWKRAELDGQFIEFSLSAKVPMGIRTLEGIGKMAVRENSRGEIAIDIFITQYETPYQAVQTRIWLAQDAVDRIELNPKPEPAKFRLIG